MIGDESHPTLPCPRPTTTISAYSLMHLNGPECRNRVEVWCWPAFAANVGWVVAFQAIGFETYPKTWGDDELDCLLIWRNTYGLAAADHRWFTSGRLGHHFYFRGNGSSGQ